MIQKSDTNLGTKDLNQIINILINEVMNYPRFWFIQNWLPINEVFDELKNKASEIGKSYIDKNNIEEKEKKEREQRLKELNDKAEKEK